MRLLPFLVAAAALAAPASAAADCLPHLEWGPADHAFARQVVELTNQHRASLNPPAPPLTISRTLTRSAIWKSRHMNQYRYFEHNDPAPPVARNPHERAMACGYPQQIGENIAFGQLTPESVFQAWLNSPNHRANIERQDYTAIGVGESGRYWTQNFGFTSDSPNTPPTAQNDAPSATEDLPARVTPLDNDVDDDLDWAYVESVAQPPNGTVEITEQGRALNYVPKPDFAGPDSFTYTVIDLAGERATGTVTVAVANVNDVPTAVADVARLRKRLRRAVIAAAANDTDVDGDRLRVKRIVKAPRRGTAKVMRGKVEYRPRRGRVRRDRLTYRVADGHGGTDEATVRIVPKR
jgi:uncharacterized protein YkwD